LLPWIQARTLHEVDASAGVARRSISQTNHPQGESMKTLKFFAVASLAAIGLSAAAARPPAQVSVSVGVAPDCPYGYYDYAPYACAPYGYYGPEWFTGGVFIGVGPWFHGPANFHGHVNTHFDVQHGYKGPAPNRGDKPEPGKRLDKIANFKGNEVRDGRGHVAR
jgi:hypothetical protein